MFSAEGRDAGKESEIIPIIKSLNKRTLLLQHNMTCKEPSLAPTENLLAMQNMLALHEMGSGVRSNSSANGLVFGPMSAGPVLQKSVSRPLPTCTCLGHPLDVARKLSLNDSPAQGFSLVIAEEDEEKEEEDSPTKNIKTTSFNGNHEDDLIEIVPMKPDLLTCISEENVFDEHEADVCIPGSIPTSYSEPDFLRLCLDHDVVSSVSSPQLLSRQKTWHNFKPGDKKEDRNGKWKKKTPMAAIV